MRLPKAFTWAFVPLVAASAPPALSAALASSSTPRIVVSFIAAAGGGVVAAALAVVSVAAGVAAVVSALFLELEHAAHSADAPSTTIPRVRRIDIDPSEQVDRPESPGWPAQR